MRVVFIQILLFLAPFALYAAWLAVVRRDPLDAAVWRGPIGWLLVGGAALAVVVVSVLADYSGAPPGAHYVAPHEVGGHIVPGHFDKGAGR